MPRRATGPIRSRMMWWTTPAPGIECAKGSLGTPFSKKSFRSADRIHHAIHRRVVAVLDFDPVFRSTGAVETIGKAHQRSPCCWTVERARYLGADFACVFRDSPQLRLKVFVLNSESFLEILR